MPLFTVYFDDENNNSATTVFTEYFANEAYKSAILWGQMQQ